jgi:(1->4)-alpha-D-glucan 1-alpha-D-glucosylmutase
LVGAWPITPQRLREYMQKAMREAKVRTSWVANNAEYESAVGEYIEALLGDAQFIADMQVYVDRLAAAGRVNSLTQTLLKYTAPGVPDMYQGGELWDLSLVDPDNRRPVDYALRARLLNEMSTMNAAQVIERMEHGLPKMWVVNKALALRNERPEWFGAEAAYTPVAAQGPQYERVIAYLRGDRVLTVVPRWTHGEAAWGNTELALPVGRWLSVLTDEVFAGGPVAVEALLRAFPVALLRRQDVSR